MKGFVTETENENRRYADRETALMFPIVLMFLSFTNRFMTFNGGRWCEDISI